MLRHRNRPEWTWSQEGLRVGYLGDWGIRVGEDDVAQVLQPGSGNMVAGLRREPQPCRGGRRWAGSWTSAPSCSPSPAPASMRARSAARRRWRRRGWGAAAAGGGYADLSSNDDSRLYTTARAVLGGRQGGAVVGEHPDQHVQWCGVGRSVTAGTIFDRTRTLLTVWLAACWGSTEPSLHRREAAFTFGAMFWSLEPAEQEG